MNTTPSTIETIRPHEVAAHKHSMLLLDVRTPAEYEDTHIEGAVLQPLTDLNPSTVAQMSNGKREVVVICRSGGRARQAAEKLSLHPLPSLRIMEGGMQSWEGAGLPVIQGRKTISLERQVRIAAGSLVFLGSTLGYFVHPAWIALSAFVGAGLVFAGITDTCGMGMLIARMPWNARSSSAQKSQQNSCCSA